MEENAQKQGEISLFDLIKTLLKKIKVLIVVLLAGLIAGASVGVIQTANVLYYGTKITFYINPRKSNTVTENNSQYGVYGAYGAYVMDNMVTLLNSELFAERLMLNPDGLPLDTEGNLLVNDAALKILVDAAVEKKAAAKTAAENSTKADDAIVMAEKALKEAQAVLAVAEVEEERAKAAAETAAELFENAWRRAGFTAPPADDAAGNNETIRALGVAADAATRLYEEAIEATTTAFADVNAPETGKQALYEKAITDSKAALTAAKEVADEAAIAVEKALNNFRENPEYVRLLARNRDAVSFSYINKDASEDSGENLARSFIYVTISLLNDEDGAKNLYEKVMEIVPIFVEENMAIPSGYSGTNCRRITRNDEISNTNAGYMAETALTYSLVAGAAAFVVACIVIILLDRSDKRLRNYEQVMENFNVPVLGVIPTIDKEDYKKEDKQNTEGANEVV